MSSGLAAAGFEVTGVDIRPLAKRGRGAPGYYYRGGTFVQADALEVLKLLRPGDYDFVHASPPCQAHSCLRSLHPGREYPDHIDEVRERLVASGIPWCIENVPGAPLGGANLTMLCGTMFGLVTPDGRAEIRRHRLFETSFSIPLRPACQHGHVSIDALSVTGSGLNHNRERHDRRALSVTGHSAEISPTNWGKRETLIVTGPFPDRKVLTVTGHTPVDNTRDARKVLAVAGHGTPRGATGRRHVMSATGSTTQETTFSVDDARAAMGIEWMPMKYLSQAIPPAYGRWIGLQAISFLESRP